MIKITVSFWHFLKWFFVSFIVLLIISVLGMMLCYHAIRFEALQNDFKAIGAFFIFLTIASWIFAYIQNAWKKAAIEQQECNEIINKITAVASDGIIVIDNQGVIIYWNDSAEKIFGYPRQEALGKNIAELIVPRNYHEAFRKGLKNFALTGAGKCVGKTNEVLANRKDGREFYCELSVSALRRRNYWHAIGIVRDITKRKLMETVLKENNNLLNRIKTIQSEFITSSEPEVFFSHLLKHALQLTQSEFGFIGEVITSSDNAPYLKTYSITNIAWNDETRKLYKEHKAKGFEFRNLNSLYGQTLTTGQPVIANDPSHDLRSGGLPEHHPPLNAFLGIPFYYGEKMVGMAGVANKPHGYSEDLVRFLRPFSMACGEIIKIHQNNQLREAAEKQLKKLYNAVEHSPLSIVITDSQGAIEYVNPMFTKITGYTLEEAIGQNPRILKSEKHTSEFYKELWETVLSGVSWKGELYNKKKNGEYYWECASISPVKNASGEITHIVAVKEDITKKKAMDEQLKSANKALEDKNEELERFVRLTVEREIKMIELKEEVNRLLALSGQPLKYKITNQEKE
jgi:PAS domain S-box-containing protein